MESTTYTLSTLMTDIGTMFTQAIAWVGDVAAVIIENPIMLASAAVGFIGLGIGLYKRLVRV